MDKTIKSPCLRNCYGIGKDDTDVGVTGSTGVRVVVTGAEGLVLCTIGTVGSATDYCKVELLSTKRLFGAVSTEAEGFVLPFIRDCLLRGFCSLDTIVPDGPGISESNALGANGTNMVPAAVECFFLAGSLSGEV